MAEILGVTDQVFGLVIVPASLGVGFFLGHVSCKKRWGIAMKLEHKLWR